MERKNETIRRIRRKYLAPAMLGCAMLLNSPSYAENTYIQEPNSQEYRIENKENLEKKSGSGFGTGLVVGLNIGAALHLAFRKNKRRVRRGGN